MNLTLDAINSASDEHALALLDGLYEHSPWIAEQALSKRPFTSVNHLKRALVEVLDAASPAEHVRLIQAHPELAGKAMQTLSLTLESTGEQKAAGLTECSPDELALIARLNADYLAKFGFPFVLAVRGPRGLGLPKTHILNTFQRRLNNPADFEVQECLRNIHRIAALRLDAKMGVVPAQGNQVWDWCEDLAQFSDPGYAEQGQLTVTYLTPAHQACSRFIQAAMRECGFDSVQVDAVGNVVGIYRSDSPDAKTLLTGSHFDTVRNAGKHDGRLGIFTPMACVQALKQAGKRLPFAIEVVAFAEEEGQRYKATFLGSGALTGSFNPAWLDQVDADGISMNAAMNSATNTALAQSIPAAEAMKNIALIQRNPAHYLGFVEVHIEQGPVLNARNLPLGVVTGINGSCRFMVGISGMASHAGTTPMNARRDAACAAAELLLYVERRALSDAGSVGTVGMLSVPNGSTNVVPGQCNFSLDLRAPSDAQRDQLTADVLAELAAICTRRGLAHTTEQTMSASAAPSDAAWQARWAKAVAALDVPVFELPSGAGHDAMQLHKIMPQAMLFVRGENAGISHNPLESTSNSDMQLGVDAFARLLEDLSKELS
jgi:beta-ureidopropionase / N-carbamoyl-L-amino-acid hydrolase